MIQQYDSAFLKLRPPAKALSCDVIMYAVEIWGQERGKKRVSGCPTCGQKKGKQKGKNGIGPRMKNGRANHKQNKAFTNGG